MQPIKSVLPFCSALLIQYIRYVSIRARFFGALATITHSIVVGSEDFRYVQDK